MNESAPIVWSENIRKNVAEIIKAINGNRERMKKELDETENPWLACLVTPFGSMSLNLEKIISKGNEFEVVRAKTAQLALEGLNKRVLELQKTYNEKENEPPEDLQEELLFDLERIRGFFI